MSNGNLGGCQPLRPPSGGSSYEPIRSAVYDLTKLGPEDYRGVIIPMVVQFEPGQRAGQQDYKVPNTHVLVIEQIIAHVALVGIEDEKLLMVEEEEGTGTKHSRILAFDEYALLKAMMMRVKLENTDRSQPIIDGGFGALNLAALYRSPGGLDWRESPHIVPPNEQLRCSMTAARGDGGFANAATEYGLVLFGKLIRVKPS